MWEIKACEKLHDWNSPKPTELDCLTAAGPALPVCPINWSNNWVNTGHEYSSVSLLGKDLKRIASPWQWYWLLCKAFSWEGTASVLSKKEPDAISIQLFLGLDAVAALAQPVPTSELREWFCHSSTQSISTHVSWAHLPSQKPAMAAIFRTVLWLNATGAWECTFSTLPNHRIWTPLKAAAQGGGLAGSRSDSTPQPWESFVKEIFLRIKQFESIFLCSRDSNQQHII